MQAIALVCMLEGLLPFALPAVWKDTFVKISRLSEGQIRFVGLITLASGILLFNLVE